MATRKEVECVDLMKELRELNETVTDCNCESEQSKALFVQFKMDRIKLDSLHFSDPIVFAVEYHQRGSRVFLCCCRHHFVHYFPRARRALPIDWCWHEILLTVTPVRLYFDMEFYTDANPGWKRRDDDGYNSITDALWNDVSGFLTETCGLATEGDLKLFEFSATTDSKFSRHWIVHGVRFANAEAAKLIVSEFLLKFGKNYTIRGKNGTAKTTLLDMGVYSAGQNLRMLGSPKFGRDNVFRLLSNAGWNLNCSHGVDFEPNCASCETAIYASLATAETECSSVTLSRMASILNDRCLSELDSASVRVELLEKLWEMLNESKDTPKMHLLSCLKQTLENEDTVAGVLDSNWKDGLPKTDAVAEKGDRYRVASFLIWFSKCGRRTRTTTSVMIERGRLETDSNPILNMPRTERAAVGQLSNYLLRLQKRLMKQRLEDATVWVELMENYLLRLQKRLMKQRLEDATVWVELMEKLRHHGDRLPMELQYLTTKQLQNEDDLEDVLTPIRELANRLNLARVDRATAKNRERNQFWKSVLEQLLPILNSRCENSDYCDLLISRIRTAIS